MRNTRRILEANPAATTTLGYGNAELVEMQIDDLFYACDGDVLKPVQPELHAATRADRILIVRCHNKDFIDVEVTANPLMIDEREVISFVLRDVSARRKAERQLVHNQEQALASRASRCAHRPAQPTRARDGVCPGSSRRRRSVAGTSPSCISTSTTSRRSTTFAATPAAIVCCRWRQSGCERCLSADDLVVRMGGDEFVVVASELRDTTRRGLHRYSRPEKLAEPFEVDGQELRVTSSVGVSVFPDDGADYELLLKNADIALYDAKDSGRDTFTLFSRNLTSRVSERLAIEHELRDAIRDGQFYLDYQPLIDLRTNRIASLEALVRWRQPAARPRPADAVHRDRREGRPHHRHRRVRDAPGLPADRRVAAGGRQSGAGGRERVLSPVRAPEHPGARRECDARWQASARGWCTWSSRRARSWTGTSDTCDC